MAKEYLIGDFLKRVKRQVEIQDDLTYKRVTIRGNHKGINLRDEVSGSVIGTKNQFIVHEGDFLLSKIDARYGAFGVVPNEVDKGIITGNFWAYNVDKSIVNENWFLAYTSSDLFLQICEASSTGTTHRKYLDEKTFLNHKVQIPSIENQNEIVEIANRNNEYVFKLNAETSNQEKLLSQLRQSILQEAIQGKLTENWRKENPNTEPAETLLQRIKIEKEKTAKKGKKSLLPEITENEIPFELPENWVWCRLGEIGITQTGTTPSKNNSKFYGNHIPFIQPRNITEAGLNFDCIYLSESGLNDGRFIKKHSNLMVCIGGSAGKTCYNEIDVSCNQQINTITAYDDISHKYIDVVLKSPHFYSSVWSSIKQGSTPILNKGKWEQIIFPLPPLSEQHAIVEQVERLLGKCTALQTEIENLNTHSKTLLKALFAETFETNKILENEIDK